MWGSWIRISVYICFHTHKQFRKIDQSMRVAYLRKRWCELRMNMERRESLSYIPVWKTMWCIISRILTYLLIYLSFMMWIPFPSTYRKVWKCFYSNQVSFPQSLPCLWYAREDRGRAPQTAQQVFPGKISIPLESQTFIRRWSVCLQNGSVSAECAALISPEDTGWIQIKH